MSSRTELLLTNTSGQLEGVGEPRKGNAWFGSFNPIHTVQITISKYIGTITLEASLAKNPKEDDWFPIWLNIERPELIFDAPLNEGITDTFIFNIEGNFLWFRAKFDRSNLSVVPPREEWSSLGIINKILLVR